MYIFSLVIQYLPILRNSWDIKASSLGLVAASFQKFEKNDIKQGKFPSWGNLPICVITGAQS